MPVLTGLSIRLTLVVVAVRHPVERAVRLLLVCRIAGDCVPSCARRGVARGLIVHLVIEIILLADDVGAPLRRRLSGRGRKTKLSSVQRISMGTCDFHCGSNSGSSSRCSTALLALMLLLYVWLLTGLSLCPSVQ